MVVSHVLVKAIRGLELQDVWQQLGMRSITRLAWGGGVKPNSGEQSEGVGGTFGTLTPLNTATKQELPDCDHSKAHHF